MTTLLSIISWATAVATFLFVTLSLASGLLWLAEVIEEHSRTAKVVGSRAIYVIIILHVLLYFSDSLPLPQLAFSIVAHLVYLQNFSNTWPFISLTSFSFIGSCFFVLADHFLWFFYFAGRTQSARQRAGSGRGSIQRGYSHKGTSFRAGRSFGDDAQLGFLDVASFFAICVWLVPLFLFLSLSANDNALPTAGHAAVAAPSTPSGTESTSQKPVIRLPPPRTSLFKQITAPITALFQSKPRHRRQRSEGIIAPRTPNRSPLLSPNAGPPLSPVTWDLDSNGADGSQFLTLHDGTPAGGIPAMKLTSPPPPRRANTLGAAIRTNDGGQFETVGLTVPRSPNNRLGRRIINGNHDGSQPPSPSFQSFQ